MTDLFGNGRVQSNEGSVGRARARFDIDALGKHLGARIDILGTRLDELGDTLGSRLDRLIAATIQERTYTVERFAEIERRLTKLEERVGV